MVQMYVVNGLTYHRYQHAKRLALHLADRSGRSQIVNPLTGRKKVCWKTPNSEIKVGKWQKLEIVRKKNETN